MKLNLATRRKRLQTNLTFEHKTKKFSDKRAIATIYASIAALIIVFMVLTLVASFFANYTTTLKAQTLVSQEKGQESIVIRDVGIKENTIQNITIQNWGTIQSKIRAIYLDDGGSSSLISDPKTIISPSGMETIFFNPPIDFDSDCSLFAATERGTLSQTIFLPDYGKTEYVYDTENLDIGSLRLKFSSFEYRVYDDSTNTWGPLQPGWNPPIGLYLQWKVNVTNIGTETLILNNFTALSLEQFDGSNDALVWYINATDQASLTKTIPPGELRGIEYLLKTPGSDATKESNWNKITGSQSYPNMVFLTFFGQILHADGTKTAYGQTIPFEAAIPTGG